MKISGKVVVVAACAIATLVGGKGGVKLPGPK